MCKCTPELRTPFCGKPGCETPGQIPCAHHVFHANVRVYRIEDVGAFKADIEIKCSTCGTPFEFLGLAPGSHPGEPMCSIDGRVARMPIAPPGHTPNPLQRMGFSITKLDG